MTDYAVVVPIKPLNEAKTRLAIALRNPKEREALALAFALDTVSAAKRAVGVRTVVAVTADARIISALDRIGVVSVPEPSRPGMNAAVQHGADRLGTDIAVLTADLPALKSTELTAALERGAGDRAFCRDRHGTGTTMLLAPSANDLDPKFGFESAAAHLRSGATPLHGRWPSLRCDVDTVEDLRVATSIGLGPHTRDALSALLLR
ncbi:2-phospho-L-lactate guanylyltransferase [Dactylosporangium sp. NPDC049525]|uniref:2-phospho-L-lactate guanylyltransferase n=1 Tax=Dactylosporangium sp. NPDC049525 TaxID=3154730 RepID=UPI003421E567